MSHIITMKVWDTLSESVTDYANIERIVKKQFVEKTHRYGSVQYQWQIIPLSLLDKSLGMGDIVTYFTFKSEQLLIESVAESIAEIETELRQSCKLHTNSRIVYKIIKPVTQSLI